MKDGKKRLPIVSEEEAFLANEDLKLRELAIKKQPKHRKKKFRIHW